ncbi:MAG TPA: RNA-splicing ligase RtcB [Aquifex aeolicus]|uniref:tRNA-splicing ligase RtcB n=1 Tax=Aquifex aeolicus TaxID=63363 RepID=A0A9D0YPN3_AQUAO|nr:RNA-splicing ligase RtcB [Aquifex aeolicus]
MELKGKLQRIGNYEYILPRQTVYPDQREVKFFLNETLYGLLEESAVLQAVNASRLPGVVEPVVVMPDVHVGYGFPIGGVMATDPAEGGIISPGAIGYDINCLPEGTPILTAYGYTLEVEKVDRQSLLGGDREKGNLKEVKPVLKFQKRAKKLLRIKTDLGYEICLTEDHPIFTDTGTKSAKNLKVGDRVLIYPFKGVPYGEPEEFTILETVGDEKLDKELRKRNLLPLTSKSEKLPTVLKLLGYLTGGGHLSESRVYFYGSSQVLNLLKGDIEKLGFTPRQAENWVGVSAKSLARFFEKLSTLKGNSREKTFGVPEWLFKLPKWMKRLYLASLFGAEINKVPSPKGKIFCKLTFSVSGKSETFQRSLKFANDLKSLLKELGIKTSKVESFKDGNFVRVRFHINSEGEILKFFERVGYEYAPERKKLGLYAVGYIRRKLFEKGNRRKEIREAKLPKVSGMSVSEMVLVLNLKESVKIERDFPSFEEWLKENTFGDFVIASVVEIEEEPYNGWVYDFTVSQREHNFIAGGFLVSNCGVRLIATDLQSKEIKKYLDSIMRSLLLNVPAGVGSTSKIKLSKSQMREVLRLGAKWAVAHGWGKKEDLDHIEGYGQLAFADPEVVSNEAYERGSDELGTVGSGNHFVELQEVEEIYDEKIAKALGFFKGQVAIMVHSGSRGLGHQVATDYIKVALKASQKYRINLPDPELACMPFTSPEGQRYWGAMNAAANYAFANRQILGWISASTLAKVLGTNIKGIGYKVIYDHAHNIGKLEAHKVNGKEKILLIHRKGATRSFPPKHSEVPPAYKEFGQPVIIPGDMGRYSYLLVGTELSMDKSFGTSCHGAGRVMSRAKAKKYVKSLGGVNSYIQQKGLKVVARGKGTIMEEIPEAYKDVAEVIKVVAGAGIAKPILRLKPLGTLKG